MKLFKVIFLTVVAGMLLVSCYPDGPEDVDDLDVVSTFFDDEFDFSSISTYFLPDTLVEVGDPGGENDIVISDEWEMLIVDRIEMNLNTLGYNRVENPTQADVWVNASATVTVNVGYYYDYWYYWGNYYYNYYPAWGPGYYPGYYPGYPIYNSYSFTTGSVLINMQDSESFNTDIQDGDTAYIQGVWVAAINGLVSGEVTRERVERGIDKAFDQSPYLGK